MHQWFTGFSKRQRFANVFANVGNFMRYVLHLMRSLVILKIRKIKGGCKLEKKKKRLTITMSESILNNLEEMAKEMGLSKSAVITIALEEYRKGQKKWA